MVEMNESRFRRYKDKLNITMRRIEQINEWIDVELEEFICDEKTKLAVYKAFQEAAEACMDIVSMICKDMNIIPKDDYTNIEELSSKLDIDKDILREANGLRNIIVHRYNSTDDELAYESIKRITPELSRFIEVVENWLQEKIS